MLKRSMALILVSGVLMCKIAGAQGIPQQTIQQDNQNNAADASHIRTDNAIARDDASTIQGDRALERGDASHIQQTNKALAADDAALAKDKADGNTKAAAAEQQRINRVDASKARAIRQDRQAARSAAKATQQDHRRVNNHAANVRSIRADDRSEATAKQTIDQEKK